MARKDFRNIVVFAEVKEEHVNTNRKYLSHICQISLFMLCLQMKQGARKETLHQTLLLQLPRKNFVSSL